MEQVKITLAEQGCLPYGSLISQQAGEIFVSKTGVLMRLLSSRLPGRLLAGSQERLSGPDTSNYHG